MNLPIIFNIAIGLIFIYLVLSLLASQIQEVLATLLEWRAEHLTRSIENLVLGDTNSESDENKKTYDLVDDLFRNPLIQNLNQTSKSWIATIPKKIISWIAKIPVIQIFIPHNKESNRNTINPTYLPAETFSSTVLYELGIPKAARILTWLNAKKLIHDEIYNKIDELIKINNSFNSEDPKTIREEPKTIIEKPYKKLSDCVKSVLDDYKMERYGLSSTLIRLRTHIETFKNEIKISSENIEATNPNVATIKNLINQIIENIEFIFKANKNNDKTNEDNDDLVNRIRPSLTTVLDHLIILPKANDLENQAVEVIFTPKKINRHSYISKIANLTDFLDILQPSNISNNESYEYIGYIQVDKILAYKILAYKILAYKTVAYKILINEILINKNLVNKILKFIFEPAKIDKSRRNEILINKILKFIFEPAKIDKSRREEFSKYLDCLISNDTSKDDKLSAYQDLKSALKKHKNDKTNEEYKKNVDRIYKVFIDVENYSIPLAYQNFQISLAESKEKADPSKLESANDLYDSFIYSQRYFSSISYRLPESLRKSLYALALRSRIKASDIDKQLNDFKQEVEVWFDRSMERASGVYKRNARGFAFLIGFVLAVTLNADTFYIVSRLAKDDALRNSIVSSSTQLVQNVQAPNPSSKANQSTPSKTSPTSTPTATLTSSPNIIEKVKDTVDQSLSDITLPIGWTDNILDEQLQVNAPAKGNETTEETQKREKQNREKDRRKTKFFGRPIHPLLIMIMGWLITATAIMMGAPFWFDFLGLFINVRNTGGKPESKTNNK